MIVGITVLSLAWLVVTGEHPNGFAPDYWLMFGTGSLLYIRMVIKQSTARHKLIEAALWTIFILSVVAEVVDYDTGGRAYYFETLITSGFALLLLYTRSLDDIMDTSIGQWFKRLGLISYSLYLTNQFNLTQVKTIVTNFLPSIKLKWVLLIPEVSVLIVIATAFWFFCERPFLNRPLPQE